MKKHLNFIFLSIIAIAVSSLVSWDMPFNPFRKKLDLDLGKYSEPKKEDDSYMKVLQVSPKGEVPEGFSPKEVVLVFNHPLIPLGTLEEETKGVFQISPEIKGKFRWYGSRICAFIPSEPWDLRQEYTIRVSGDLKAINGKSMKESFQSTFKLKIPKLNVDLNTAYTEDPEMDYDYQEYSYNTSEDIRPIQKFSLSFSQKVSEKQVNKKLSIIADGKSIPFILVGEKDKKSFTFINTKPFSKSSNVMVRLEPGLESLEYSGNYTDDILKVYKSWGDLEIEMKDCDFQYFQSRWYCRFVFNHPVQGENAIRAIQVSPDMQMSQKPKGPIRRLKLAHWRPVSGKSYTFSFSSKLKDIFGYELGKKEVFQIKVPEYKPDFSVDSYYSVLESKMQSKLPIDIANIPAMNVKVGKLSLDSIHKKMQFKPEWKNGSYTYFDYFAHASNTKEHLWKTGSSKYKGQRYGYDLSPYLNSNKKGWLAVRFNNKITQFVQSTDLGITVKEDYKKAYAWVHSLTDGTPLSGVTVSSYLFGNKKDSCTTNSEGTCSLKPGEIYVSEKNDDMAFVDNRDYELSMYSLVRSGSYSSEAIKPLISGSVFYDRKLYRPGDKVSWKALLGLREKGKYRAAGNMSFEVKITDAKGEEVYSKNLKSSEEGGIWGDYSIPGEASLGHYTIRIDSSYKQTISDTFQVEEFRPVSFSVKVQGKNDAVVSEKFKFSIEGKYLFGAPMSEAELELTLKRYSTQLFFPEYEDYTIGSNLLEDEESKDYSQTGMFIQDSTKLGLDGVSRQEVELKPMLLLEKIHKPSYKEYKLSSSYRVDVEAKVSDKDSKSVTSRSSVRVRAGEFIPGIKVEEAYQDYRTPFKFKIIALGSDGKPMRKASVRVRVIKRNWQSVETKSSENSKQRKNTLINELVEEETFSIGSSAYEYFFSASEAGQYSITVQEKEGMSFVKIPFYAYGGAYTSWYKNEDSTFEMQTNRSSYTPGETAKVVIKSPFSKCLAIVSLERENLIWQKTIEIDEKGLPIEVPIKEEYLPNVYLSVVLLRPRTSKPDETDSGRPQVKAGIIKINVNTDSRKIPLQIISDKNTYKPGETVSLKLKSVPGAEVAFTVADEGVLSLISYFSYPNPVATAFTEWPLGVKILENRHMLIKQYVFAQKGENPGGDIYDEQGGGFAFDNEDGSRKDIRYTAYWKADVVLDSKGEKSIRFKLPDNLSTFRIMAVAAKTGRYGTSEKTFQVAKPMVVMTNVPRVIRPGDRLQIGGTVVNQTGIEEDFKISIKTNLLKAGRSQKIIHLKHFESKEVTFPVTVDMKKYSKILMEKKEKPLIIGYFSAEPLKISKFQILNLKKKDVVDRLKFSFPIREEHPEEAFTISHYTDSEEKEQLRLPAVESYIPNSANMKVSFSSSALIGMENAFEFYKSNPYFCSEQRTSAFLLALTSGSLLEKFSFVPPDNKAYDFSNIKALFIDEIKDFQGSKGGFGLWKDSRHKSDPYLSAYIAYVLQVAKKAGYNIDERVHSRLIQFLKDYIRTPEKDGYSYILESMSLIALVLSREGEDTDSIHHTLMDKFQDLSLRAKANLSLSIAELKKLKSYNDNSDTKKLFEHIQNGMEFTARKVIIKDIGSGSYGRAFYTDASAIGSVLQALMRLDYNSPLIPKIVQYAVSAKQHLWWDSHSSGNLAYALKMYSDTYEKSSGPRIAGAFLNELSIARANFKGNGKPETFAYTVSLEEIKKHFPKETNVNFIIRNEEKKGRTYYTASLEYQPRLKDVKARDEGFEIKQEIYDIAKVDLKNPHGIKVQDVLERGKVYLVKLSVFNPKPYEQVVLKSPIPSHSEIVNPDFDTEQSGLKIFPTKSRQADDYWWVDPQERMEYRDDKIVLTTSYMYEGLHEYFYLLRPTQKGLAYMPSTEAKLMYEPEVFGRSDSRIIKVR